MNNNNPLNMVKNFIKQGGTPEQLFTRFMQVNKVNPLVEDLIKKAQKGDVQGLQTFGRNLYKEKGSDFDNEYNQFKIFFGR